MGSSGRGWNADAVGLIAEHPLQSSGYLASIFHSLNGSGVGSYKKSMWVRQIRTGALGYEYRLSGNRWVGTNLSYLQEAH